MGAEAVRFRPGRQTDGNVSGLPSCLFRATARRANASGQEESTNHQIQTSWDYPLDHQAWLALVERLRRGLEAVECLRNVVPENEEVTNLAQTLRKQVAEAEGLVRKHLQHG